jgi:hypothetical protein
MFLHLQSTSQVYNENGGIQSYEQVVPTYLSTWCHDLEDHNMKQIYIRMLIVTVTPTSAFMPSFGVFAQAIQCCSCTFMRACLKVMTSNFLLYNGD